MTAILSALLWVVPAITGGYLMMGVAASWGALVLARDGVQLLNDHSSRRALHQRHYVATIGRAVWEIAIVVLAAFAISVAISCLAPRVV